MYGRQYYQQTAPMGTFGTNQYQMGRPPPISFQPQPNWSGLDYFNAHAFNADPNVYNQAYASLNNYSSGNVGATRDTAKRWHRRIYASDPNQYDFLPQDLGYAAAYEAYRQWKYNSSLSQPLSGDRERQREALIGLAIAEATRLMNTTYFAGDPYKRSLACNSAAATASELFRHYDARTSGFTGRSYSRPGSRAGSDYGSDYGYRGRSRSRSRYDRSPSRDRYSSYGTPFPTSTIPIPGIPQTGSSIGGYDNPYIDSYGRYPAPMTNPALDYPGSGSYPNQVFPSSIPIGQRGAPMGSAYDPMNVMPAQYTRSRSRSFGGYTGSNYGTPFTTTQPMPGYYPQQPPPQVYSTTSGYGQPIGQQPAQTIVVHHGSSRRHHHRSRSRGRSQSHGRHHHHQRRSRSREPKYIGYH